MKGRRGKSVREDWKCGLQMLHIITGCVLAREGRQIVSALFVLSFHVLHVKVHSARLATGAASSEPTEHSFLLCFSVLLTEQRWR